MLEEASDQTQNTPPTASAAPDRTGQRDMLYTRAQRAKPSIESGIR